MPNFNVPMIGQGNSKCCWLACYAMMYGYQRRPTDDPEKICKRIGISTTSGLDSDDWGKARDAMSLTSYRVSYLTESFSNLNWVLDKHGPVWCAGNFLENGSPHAIVISGYDGEKLRINDPFEIYKYYSYNYMYWSRWKKLVKNLPYGCQVWF